MPQEERDLWSSSDLTPVLTLTRSRGSQIRHVVAEVESSCFLSHPAQSPNLHREETLQSCCHALPSALQCHLQINLLAEKLGLSFSVAVSHFLS